jgi:serine-type D-Ala-D-Ala carboxypeptidase/endopeptidase (penicillin-binding protein 4)
MKTRSRGPDIRGRGAEAGGLAANWVGAVVVMLIAAAQAAAASLSQAIPRVVNATPSARNAFWGIQVMDLASGKVLYSRNADRLFVPASNAKLFTLALALARLGPDYRFETRVLADAAPGAEGRLRGALRLAGGGDPNLSARPIPYRPNSKSGDPLGPMEQLADQVVAHGVKRVDGGIVGDDTWYVWEPYPEGWAVDDTQYDYGAPVSALSFNDNELTVTVRPGLRAGDIAQLTLEPALESFVIDNRVRTTAPGIPRQIHSEHIPGSRQVRFWGTIPVRDGGDEVSLAVADPADYAARALRRALEERGVLVEGGIQVRHRFAGEPPLDNTRLDVELARRESAPLLEDLRVTAKVSQNLHAELALRAVARARRSEGSREAGLQEMQTFLSEIGIAPNSDHFADGSGLSRLDLVTPASVVRLLRFMYDSPQRQDWIGLMPVGGQDGTLQSRLGGVPAADRIHAKTGTLTHVSALSGYAQRRNGSWVAFSILVNNDNGPAAEVRGAIDQICHLILE